MFDLNLIPLNYSEGQEQAGLPGLYAAAPPRRAARGRTGDLLVMLISLQNSTPYAPGELQKLHEQLAQTFYQIPGTVTTALRSVVEVLSQALLDRNLRSASAGRQGLALLNLAAIHGNQLYLAHSGPTHSFVVSPRAVEHFTDPQLAGRGLGLSRTVSIRYYQASVETGSSLVFCPEPPPAWNTSLLSSSAALPADVLRRRLVGQARPNLSAAVIQFQEGSGKINLNGKTFLAPDLNRTSPPASATPVGEPAPDQGKIHPEIKTPEAAQKPTILRVTTPPPAAERSGTVQSPVSQVQTPATPSSVPAPQTPRRSSRVQSPSSPGLAASAPAEVQAPTKPAQQSSQAGVAGSTTVTPPDVTIVPGRAQPSETHPGERLRSSTRRGRQPSEPALDEPVIQEIKRRRSQSFPWSRVAPYWKWMHTARQRAGQFFQAVVTRLLPASSEPGKGPSPALLTFIAFAVPLVIAAIGLVVYLEKGLADQYLYNFGQAQLVASEAAAQSDPQIARNDWESTLIWLETADKYKVTVDSAALHQKAQNALDQLDAVVRLIFQPALISELPKDVRITRMVSVGNDLYLLDASQGSVIRAFLTGQGYEVDISFQCGPGPSGSLIISPLVDILPMPYNNPFKATIAAIDGAGNMLYCLPGDTPVANYSGLTAPGDRWGKITAIALDNNQLYVLDPRTNIGVYSSNQDGSFNDKPDLFFENVPAMGDAVDMAVNAQDLYLLHSDGHMTLCTFSPVGVEPTRCTDPAPYADPRPGNSPNPTTFPEAHFSRIEYTAPPDPSIYLLDPNTATIYHFSLRLNLQRLLRPQALSGYLLPGGPATGFYISQDRTVFMAFGNQVLLSYLP
jgi:hypothetical protein